MPRFFTHINFKQKAWAFLKCSITHHFQQINLIFSITKVLKKMMDWRFEGLIAKE